VSLLNRHEDNPPATSLNRVAPNDLIRGPVGTFDEHVGLHEANDFGRRVLVKNDDGVDAFERSDDLCPLGLWCNRTVGALVSFDGDVGIQADDQQVAETARVLQVANVARMKEIEHAVGKHNPASTGARRPY
jgi:hypothetical protein